MRRHRTGVSTWRSPTSMKRAACSGRKIEIVMRDSAADPSKAVSFAKELVYNENIDVLCGPINSGEALPTLGIVSGAKKLHLIGGSVEELIDPVKYPLRLPQPQRQRPMDQGRREVHGRRPEEDQDRHHQRQHRLRRAVARDGDEISGDAQSQAGLCRDRRSQQAGRHRRSAEGQGGRRRRHHRMVERHRLRRPPDQCARRAELERADRRSSDHPAGAGGQAAVQALLLGQCLWPRLRPRDRRCAGQAAGQRPGLHGQAQG